MSNEYLKIATKSHVGADANKEAKKSQNCVVDMVPKPTVVTESTETANKESTKVGKKMIMKIKI